MNKFEFSAVLMILFLWVCADDNGVKSDTEGSTQNPAGLSFLSTATLKDQDKDGRIDAVTLVFDEAIKDSTFIASEWTFSGNAGTGLASGTVDDNTMTVLYATDDLPVDTSASGAAIVFLNGTSVENLSGDKLAAIAAITETDGVKPVAISAKYIDGDSNGVDIGDTIDITFSETIISVSGLIVGDVTLPVSSDSLGAGPAFALNGGLLRITLGTAPILTITGVYDGTIGAGSSSGINIKSFPTGNIEDNTSNNATNRTGTGKSPEAVDITP